MRIFKGPHYVGKLFFGYYYLVFLLLGKIKSLKNVFYGYFPLFTLN
jgi:hypothetical protein